MLNWDKNLNRILSGISLEEKKDKRVIKEVAFHPLLFLKRNMESGNLDAVRLKYFGVFAPKTGHVNKLGAMNYIGERLLKNIDEVWECLPENYYKIYETQKEFEESIRVALVEHNKPFLDKIYKIYKYYLEDK